MVKIPARCLKKGSHSFRTLLNGKSVSTVRDPLSSTGALDQDAGQSAGRRFPHDQSVGIKSGGEQE